MNLSELRQILNDKKDLSLRLQLPGGQIVPEHFHVTEIGKVSKDYIDCGGTRRKSETCVLQILVSTDQDHRLAAEKLDMILEKSGVLELHPTVQLEAELQSDTISLYSISNANEESGSLVFHLESKQAACLAPDKCGLELNAPYLPVFESGGGDCGSSGCC
ncbi:MAG: DUF6428 family protein [Planctomycetota bacterium]